MKGLVMVLHLSRLRLLGKICSVMGPPQKNAHRPSLIEGSCNSKGFNDPVNMWVDNLRLEGGRR